MEYSHLNPINPMNDLFKDFAIIEIPPTEEDRKKDQFDYWQRFTEAEKDGAEAIYNTFNKIIKECHEAEHPFINITELYIIANHKMWEHRKTNVEFARHYNDMQNAGYNYIIHNFTAEELEYFYLKTD